VNVTDSSFSTAITYTSIGLNDNIDVGTPLTISNFITATLGSISSSDQSGTISAAFTFTDPSALTQADGGTISGSFTGVNLRQVVILWSDPLTLTFADGTKLQIDLANRNPYNCIGNGGKCGQGEQFNIAATFTLLNGPTDPVGSRPLPGALPLMASGLGAFGVFGWRRRKRTIAA